MNYAGFTRPVWTWLREPRTSRPTSSGVAADGAAPRRPVGAGDHARVLGDRPLADRPAQLQPGRVARHHPDPHPRGRGRPAGRRRCRAADDDARRSRWSPTATRSAWRATSARTAAGRCRGTRATGTQDCCDVYRGLIAARRSSVGPAARRPALGPRGRGTPWSSCGETPEETALVHCARARPRHPVDFRATPDGSRERPVVSTVRGWSRGQGRCPWRRTSPRSTCGCGPHGDQDGTHTEQRCQP